MSPPIHTIDLVVEGGPRIGFGHLMRSGAIAAEAIRRGLAVRAFLRGDSSARTKLAEASGCREILDWEAWPSDPLGSLMLIDLPGDKTPWLERAAERGIPAVVLDDARARGRAALTICPALHEVPVEAPDLVAGPRYTVLSRGHLETPRVPLDDRDELLLSLGGADPHRATFRVAPLIERLLDEEAVAPRIRTRHAVLGPGFPDPDGGAGATLDKGGWQVHHALPIEAMAQRMARSRIAVIGFGTSLGELAWLGTPHLSITHHEHDDAHARRLEACGIGMHLGFAPRLDPAYVTCRLRTALADDAWQSTSAELALAALEDGRGSSRIVERLAGLLPSPASDRARPTIPKGTHVAPS